MKDKVSYSFELASGKMLCITFSLLNEFLSTYNFSLELNGFHVGSKSVVDINKKSIAHLVHTVYASNAQNHICAIMNNLTNDDYNIRNGLLLEVARDKRFKEFKNPRLSQLLEKGIIKRI